MKKHSMVIVGLLACLCVIFGSACGSTAQVGNDVAVLKYDAQRYYWGKGVRQNLPKAFGLYLRAAQLGDAEAQYIVGGMYFRGIGTDKDSKEAFKWLYKAGLNGESTTQSQKLLGQAFLLGNALPQNYTASVEWYKKAAENGDRDAQNELAFLYYTGRGMEQNFKTSYEWFEKAARNGLTIAQYNVGIMWYTGNGVDKADLVKAYIWLNLAAAGGHPDAEAATKYIATLLSPAEIQSAQEQSTRLYDEINKSASDRSPQP